MISFETTDQLLQLVPGGYRETAEVVLDSGAPGRKKIRQSQIVFVIAFLLLLTESMKSGPLPLPFPVGKDNDVVALGVRDKKTVDGSGQKELPFDDFVQ